VLIFAVVLLFGSASALGDWFPDTGTHKMHYPQLPDLNDTGLDVLAGPFIYDPDSGGYYEKFLADDFMCTESGPITGIHIWTSYLNDIRLTETPYFSVVIYDNVPADAQYPFSRPGNVVWDRYLRPTAELIYASDVIEHFYDPNPDEIIGDDTQVWQFNFIIDEADAFMQEEGTIYWLGIHHSFDLDENGTLDIGDVFALQELGRAGFGWKTSGVQQYEDDAVWTDVDSWTVGTHVIPSGEVWTPLVYPFGYDHPYEGLSMDLAFVIDGPAQEAELEYGDAPESVDPGTGDAIAYPDTGVDGAFPTCISIGLQGYVEHNLGWPTGPYFGASVDGETDGDASLCPPPGCFPTYDDDECYQDGDAGLVNSVGFADSFTIDSSISVVPCIQGNVQSLGTICTTANWGVNIDIDIVEVSDSYDSWVNVLADWNRNGMWGGSSSCAVVSAPEHVLVNFRVPDGYVGPLSGLTPPGFLIGPNAGHVWFRFTINDIDDGPLDEDWNGEGLFQYGGETEDYLLLIEDELPHN
jgi:hypothetical protein